MGNVYMEAEQVRYKNASYSNVQEGLDAAFAGSPEGLDGRVTALETTVGDSTAGLVKDVTDLQTTVGDSTAGLVKTVTDQGTAISGLQTTVGGAIQWDAAKTSVKKNLLNNTATTQTVNGVTFTVKDDGSVEVYGTATGGIDKRVATYTRAEFLKAMGGIGASVIMSGCPAGGSANTYFMRCNGSPWLALGDDTGSGATFTIPEAASQTEFAVNISVKSGTNMGTVDNPKIFYPMIRSASIADDTYVPSILDNVELANALKYGESAFTNVPEGATVTTNKLVKFGKVVMACATISGITATEWTTFLNVPDGFRPKTNFKVIDTSSSRYYTVFSGGYVQSSAALSANAIEIFATWITE